MSSFRIKTLIGLEMGDSLEETHSSVKLFKLEYLISHATDIAIVLTLLSCSKYDIKTKLGYFVDK